MRAMTSHKTKNSANDVDLGFWAAYVVSHHPYTLRIWLLDYLDNMAHENFDVCAKGPWDRLPRELEELEDALGVLERLDRINPSGLALFLRAMREYAEVFDAMTK